MKRLITTGLRLWTLALRFVFVFFLARYLVAEDVGLYGLLVATIAFVIYLLGMDLYTYTSREIVKAPFERWNTYVRSHSGFLACVYLVILPVLLMLFVVGLLPWQVAGWFYLISITEHIGYEIDRLLVAMSDQLGASLVIFARQAMLPTVLIPIIVFIPEMRRIDLVLGGWLIFNVVSLVLGIGLVRRNLRGSRPGRMDWAWVRKGLRVSLLFLIGSLSLRVLFTADRQLVAVLDGLDSLAAYTLAMSVGSGLSSVIAVSVHQFAYPRLVASYGSRDYGAFKQQLIGLTVQTLLIILAAALFVVLLGDHLITWVGGEIYSQFDWLLLASVGVMALFNLSMIPHYALYAMHQDRVILLSTLISVLIFACTVAATLYAGVAAVTSVVISLTFAFTCLLLVKAGFAIHIGLSGKRRTGPVDANPK